MRYRYMIAWFGAFALWALFGWHSAGDCLIDWLVYVAMSCMAVLVGLAAVS